MKTCRSFHRPKIFVASVLILICTLSGLLQLITTLHSFLPTISSISYHRDASSTNLISNKNNKIIDDALFNRDWKGILPVRRFQIQPKSGRLLQNTANATATRCETALDCNQLCLETLECDAWEFQASIWNSSNSTTCRLYAQPFLLKKDPMKRQAKYEPQDNRQDNMPWHLRCGTRYTLPCNQAAVVSKTIPQEQHFLAAWQAERNNPNSMVGYLQRRAHVVTRSDKKDANNSMSSRILVILHYHHPIPSADHVTSLLNLLKSYVPPNDFDLVVVTPQEEEIVLSGTAETTTIQSLVNPFIPYKNPTSKFGSNSYMSLPLAAQKFPGYKGYLLWNDDASIRLWKLRSVDDDGDTKTTANHHMGWWARPWVASKASWHTPRDANLDPSWKWWLKDSGSTSWPQNQTRSNLVAARAALEELCKELGSTIPSTATTKAVCSEMQHPSSFVPNIRGKADVVYVPSQSRDILKALTIFGEHDVFMEVAVPMVLALFHQRDEGEETAVTTATDVDLMRMVPPCSSIHENQNFMDPSSSSCLVIHPLKFSNPENLRYWKRVIGQECGVLCKDFDSREWRLLKD